MSKQKLELTWIGKGERRSPRGEKKPLDVAFSGANAAPWMARPDGAPGKD
ncbi:MULTISPECIES: hypothetical protein [Methylococcus]|jgi:hypothetical protein|nr:hypothetical protein [Methylococcus capsulatus]QXP89321.1 hypothetical protein KW114_09325 [Methylococcus capsulatus]